MTEKEKAAAGYLFDPSADPQNAKDITRCIDLCHAYNQCTPSDFDAKRRILEQIIGRMGKNVVITAPFWCDHGYNISIGDDFYSNHNLVITDGAKVTFGDPPCIHCAELLLYHGGACNRCGAAQSRIGSGKANSNWEQRLDRRGGNHIGRRYDWG